MYRFGPRFPDFNRRFLSPWTVGVDRVIRCSNHSFALAPELYTNDTIITRAAFSYVRF